MKTTERNAKAARQLTSVNLPTDVLAYLDAMSRKAGISRSHLVELIICDFKKNERTITIEIR